MPFIKYWSVFVEKQVFIIKHNDEEKELESFEIVLHKVSRKNTRGSLRNWILTTPL